MDPHTSLSLPAAAREILAFSSYKAGFQTLLGIVNGVGPSLNSLSGLGSHVMQTGLCVCACVDAIFLQK